MAVGRLSKSFALKAVSLIEVEEAHPKIKGSRTDNGDGPQGFASSEVSVTNNGEEVKEKRQKGKIKRVGNAEVHSLKIRGAEQNSNFDSSITAESKNVKTSRKPRMAGRSTARMCSI